MHATPDHLPRWRGANLLGLYRPEPRPFPEHEFAWLAEWGFDFARLPLCWQTWSGPERWREHDESVLGLLDEAVDYGRRHGIHVQLNFHHAPGFCVHAHRMTDEPWDLWTDDEALDACVHHWRLLAEHYGDIPNSELSINPINEPIDPDPRDHRRVMGALVEAIHEVDPDRLIVCDGTRWGRDPAPELLDLPCARSMHAYDPIQVVFYGLKKLVPQAASWPEPTWPLHIDDPDPSWDGYWDRERLRRTWLGPWQELQRQGVGVHVGEFAISDRMPHAVALAWLEDALSLWQEAGWGWAIWSLYGTLGFLDSERKDVSYDDWHGHRLDRAMLEVLRRQ